MLLPVAPIVELFIVASVLNALLTAAAKSPVETNPSFYLSIYLARLSILNYVSTLSEFSANLNVRTLTSSDWSTLNSAINFWGDTFVTSNLLRMS